MKSYAEILHAVDATYRGSSKELVILGSRSILQIYFLKPVSIWLTPLFVWLRLTPNQVTWLGFVIGVVSCVFLALGLHMLVIMGAWLYLVHRLLDHVDGNLARYSKRMSPYGHFLDGALGAIIQMGLFLSVGIGIHRQWRLNPGGTPDFIRQRPESAILAGALVASIWMVSRFIKLFYDCTLDKAAVESPADDDAASAKKNGSDGRLWRHARAANGVVPAIRLIGLIVAAYVNALAIYLAFFLIYVPAASTFQFVNLIVRARATTRPRPAPVNPD